MRSGKRGRVEIEGEPGVGKSRLIREFVRGAPAGTRVFESHCVSYGRQLPNAPVLELVRLLSGIPQGAERHATTADIRAIVDGASSDEIDALGALIGVPDAAARVSAVDPATLRARTTRGLVALVRAVAVRATLALIIEDLHWIDGSSLDFLTALDRALPAHCLLIVTYRPGSAPAWSAGVRLDHVHLDPLADADARHLVTALANEYGLVESRFDEIVARGEGNPFFIEELVRAAEHGDGTIPGDVFDVIGARIDRLEANEKDILRAGSVIGRRFTVSLVDGVVAAAPSVAPCFDRLVELGFVVRRERANTCSRMR